MSILLVHPPIAKPSEPPAGLARLRSHLLAHQVSCSVVDLNMEGISWLLHHPPPAEDRWSQRAVRKTSDHLQALRNWEIYGNPDRYKRAVHDLSHLLQLGGAPYGARLNLSNYQHRTLSPVRSADLLTAAQHPENNPFFLFFRHRISQILEETPSECLGISLNFLHQALTAFAILGYVRRDHPQVKLVLGGGLVTSWMRRPRWHNPFDGLVDHMVAGPGEVPLLDFLHSHRAAHQGTRTLVHFREHESPLEKAGSRPPRSQRQGHAPYAPREGEGEAGTLQPPPDYTGFPLHDYLSPVLVLPYSASSGCYWNRCAFCPERAEGNPYIPVPPGRVLRELRELNRRHRPGLIHFLDNALSPSLMKAMTEDPPGIPWYGFARLGSDLDDAAFCRALKRSGCIMLKVGLESGDQGVMEGESKGTTVAVAGRVLRNLKEAGIATYTYVLFGTPSETLKEARRTLQFVVEHRRHIDFMNVALFNMPILGPGTENLEKRGHYEGDLSLYTGFTHPGGWDRGRVRQFLEREFKKNEAVGEILRSSPPFFTSNHAPFFRYSSTPSMD